MTYMTGSIVAIISFLGEIVMISESSGGVGFIFSCCLVFPWSAIFLFAVVTVLLVELFGLAQLVEIMKVIVINRLVFMFFEMNHRCWMVVFACEGGQRTGAGSSRAEGSRRVRRDTLAPPWPALGPAYTNDLFTYSCMGIGNHAYHFSLFMPYLQVHRFYTDQWKLMYLTRYSHSVGTY